MSSGSDVGADGCEMEFWPVICVPSARPAEMWCVKLVLMTGSVDTVGGMAQMVDSR